MRILPVAFAAWNLGAPDRFHMVHEVSAITHAHPRSLLACGIYVQTALCLLEGMAPADAVREMEGPVKAYYGPKPGGRRGAVPAAAAMPGSGSELSHFSRVLEMDATSFAALPEDEIRSGGYVVHTLEAALWCLLNSRSYTETTLRAVNLGGDTDTTAAVAGGLAGVCYGFTGMPKLWVEAIVKRQEIEDLARRFHARVSVSG
jgi:ADP-ribosylglycohydrolase